MLLIYKVYRYVSSIEAFDKVNGHKRLDMSDTIYRLPIHMPECQSVVFRENDIEDALLRAANRPTKLTAFFNLNTVDRRARRHLYTEIPHFYVWKDKERIWSERKRGTCLTRIHYAHPSNRELFHIRLLLLHVRGPTSFMDLRTVNGHQFTTFTEAAVALGVVRNIRIWNETLEEAINVEIASSVRTLFAMICINCVPVNPSPFDLWQQYGEQMSFDFIHFQNDSVEIGMQRSLQHIQTYILAINQTMTFFGLPEPDPNVADFRERNVEPTIDFDFHLQRREEMVAQFNVEQKSAFDSITFAIASQNNQLAKCFFLDGPGGSGKTFLLTVKL